MRLPNQAKPIDRSSPPGAARQGAGVPTAGAVPASGGLPFYGNSCGPGEGGGPPLNRSGHDDTARMAGFALRKA